MARVSVIIPCHNSERFLPEALESVFQQSFGDFEVVAVDDGSTDGTRALLGRVADPRLVTVGQDNQGVGRARNGAIACSGGEYLAFLDSDDVWSPEKLARQVAFLDAHPSVALVYSDCFVIDDAGTILRRFGDTHRMLRGMVFEDLLEENFVPLCTVVMRRSIFDEIGPFPPYSVAEDYDLFLKCARRYPFDFLPEPLASYRRHSGNVSRKLALAVAELNSIYDELLHREPDRREAILTAKGRSLYLIGKTALYAGSRSEALSFLLQSVRARLAPGPLTFLALAALCSFRTVHTSVVRVHRALRRGAV